MQLLTALSDAELALRVHLEVACMRVATLLSDGRQRLQTAAQYVVRQRSRHLRCHRIDDVARAEHHPCRKQILRRGLRLVRAPAGAREHLN
jgi:hypothetical protein